MGLLLPAQFLTVCPVKIQKKFARKINAITPGRWTAYAAAGAASAMTCANSAEAEIHYSGNVFIKLTGNAQASLPLSNGASLAFKNTFGGSTFLQNFYFLMKGAISGSARQSFQIASRNWLFNLHSRDNVSAGPFGSVAGNPLHGVLIGFWSDGAFSPPEFGQIRGFVGFRFNTGKGTQYGWARIKTTNGDNNRIRDLIQDYAWGDPGDRIRTGQTSSDENTVAAVSESGSLGLLALGSQGLDAWRAQHTHGVQLTKAGLSRVTPDEKQPLAVAATPRGRREIPDPTPAVN